MAGPGGEATGTRTFSSIFARIMHTRIDLFVDIVTQKSVPPDGRDCARDLHPSSVGDYQQDNQCKWHTLVYSLADSVRLFLRAGRALGVYGSMLNLDRRGKTRE